MIKGVLRRIRSFLLAPIHQAIELQGYAGTKQTQVLLSLTYERMLHDRFPLPTFDEVGFRVLSQNDEDGILLYIFSLIGATDKKLVDIGCGNVQNSNTSNLIINHGWSGLLIDGNEKAVEATRAFYSRCPDTSQVPPTVCSAFVTAENVNDIIAKHGFQGEVDLLSLDLDGVDYWILKALRCTTPRVLVVEYQDIIGPDRALTVPYRPDFKLSDYKVNELHPDYAGASLPAFVKLTRERGYRLVGCNKYGYNAFFVRSGIGEDCLPEVSPASCLAHPWNIFGMEHRFPRVKDMDWEEV